MIRKLLFITVLTMLPFTCYSQVPTSAKEEMAQSLVNKINTLRESKGRLPLSRDKDLLQAAGLHANYMAKTKRLSHTEFGDDVYENPRDRVEVYTKIYTTVGENILYTKPVRSTWNQALIKKMVNDMYRSWKNSPGHYANMISPEYDFGDLNFALDKKTKRVYATHVFGKKGFLIPGQLSKNAFGIEPSDQSCALLLEGNKNIATNMGNSLSIEGNEVVLRYHNIALIKRMFTATNDGIAVDLLVRDQFKCDESSQLDVSPIHDGVLLKPIYRDALLQGNRAQSDFRLVTTIGIVPEHLRGKELSASLILIKEGKACSYNPPVYIPRGRYPLKEITPVIYEPKIRLLTSGIKEVNELFFPFETNEIVTDRMPIVPESKGELFRAEIFSFSSVEGDQKTNAKLHDERALFMKKYIAKELKQDNIPFEIESKEHWSLCEYQMELMGQYKIWKNGKTAVRNYINTHLEDEILQLYLGQQRVSKAILYRTGSWKANDSLIGKYNLIDALLKDDMLRANKALATIFRTKKAQILPLSFLKERLFQKEELVQNVSALLLKDIDEYRLEDVVFFVRSWLQHPENLSEGAQKNLLGLYAITSRRMLDRWDTSSESLATVMHPEKVDPLLDNYKSDDVINPLFLNFHMASIAYYGQVNNSPKINASFDFIADYFRAQSLSLEDDINLALFFNRWSSYHLTLELLLKDTTLEKLDEKGLFLLLRTHMAYDYQEIGNLEELHKKALGLNKNRWCQWMSADFQNLRNGYLKTLFCNECNTSKESWQ